jgi:hypothetical protein
MDGVKSDDWFRAPNGCVTHVAWQVGHLAVAEYRLSLRRVRGDLASDESLIPGSFIEAFGYGSNPCAEPARNPSVSELINMFDRIHEHVITYLSNCDDAMLEEAAIGAAHPQFSTKGGSLLWCAQHEMLHAGQIGLLRRIMGYGVAR